MTFGAPQELVKIFERDAHRARCAFGNAPRHLAADRADLALQLAQPGFLRVLLNDRGERRLRNMHVARSDAVLFHLFRQQVAARNLALLFFRITGQTNHFHPVAQCGLNRVQHVGRRHEHHVREIESDAQIVIAEGVVLLRVKHFEERRRWIAAKIRADLINLVEHDERVVRARLLYGLNDAAGHRADISATMPANLRLVVHAAQRETHKLSIKRTRNRASQSWSCQLPAGRPDKGSALSVSLSACARRAPR